MIQLRAARPNDASAIARIDADTWQTAYLGILPPVMRDTHSYDIRLQFWKQHLVREPQGIFLAEQDTIGPMGFVSCGPARNTIRSDAGNFRGEIYYLYVRPVCQGMGLGKQLIEAAISNLQKAGYSAVMVWVLSENSATGFYAAMGGRVIADRTVLLGGVDIAETAYGWGGSSKQPG